MDRAGFTGWFHARPVCTIKNIRDDKDSYHPRDAGESGIEVGSSRLNATRHPYLGRSPRVDAVYPRGYNDVVTYTVQQTGTFVAWHASLHDLRAKVAIARRLDRIAAGLLGDTKPVGGAVSEARVDVGKGYRLYFTVRRRVVVVLLCGGDKRTQHADIARARTLAKEV